ncbi:MAG: glucosaminidase domain-containing protein [Candidatus Sumerlaeota bacterium]|nr:glucosaminidase domain-containing protein [Candidatus Sumerlaeota bacterium]
MVSSYLRVGILLTFLSGFCLGAEERAPQQDPIGALIQQAIQGRQQTARKPIEVAQAPLSRLYPMYEAVARNMVRALLAHHRRLLQQPRSDVEEMLRAVLAQAAYESGNFQSGLAILACNYWGMKDRPEIQYDRILYRGEYYEKFADMYQGCCGYTQFLLRAPYAGLERHLSDKRDFLAFLTQHGWCPKPTYVEETLKVYEGNRTEIDRAARVAVDELAAAIKR